MSTVLDDKTLAVLRMFPNPFADAVRPEFTDPTFSATHVPEILALPREQLLQAIDSYRVESYASHHSLPLSAAITIVGPRGAGKTHLLESIQHRSDGKPQLIVVRQTESFDENLSFEEYLYQLLIQALLEPNVPSGVRYFEALATQLTRLILLQTVDSMSPVEKLFATRPAGEAWYRLLFGAGGRNVLERFDALAKDLERPTFPEELRSLQARHRLQEADLGNLALAYLNRVETGADSLSIIRRELYSAMIRATLNHQTGALNEFLEADYRPTNVRTIYRADVVRQLLLVLSETCALVRLPIVFAFDNLEGLLTRADRISESRVAAFLEGIAQTISHFRGMLFLIFAEEGMATEMRKIGQGRWSQSRLERGVSLPGKPPLHRMHLPAPKAEELKKLIGNRMTSIRAALPAADAVPDWFPFSLEFVSQIGSSDQVIRGKIESLRNEYDVLVFGAIASTPATGGQVEPNQKESERASLAARVWKLKQSEAGRKLDSSLLGNGQGLAQGLGELLQSGLADSSPSATVHPLVEIGDDPRYGSLCLIEHPANGTTVRIAIGLLLASGRGMAMDLQSKLAAFHDEKTRAGRLVVLWLTNNAHANLADALPARTREVWDEAGAGRKTTLRRVDMADLRRMLAFPIWRDEVRKEAPDFPESAIRRFVTENCHSILALAAPDGILE